jgi:hypothetical protein
MGARFRNCISSARAFAPKGMALMLSVATAVFIAKTLRVPLGACLGVLLVAGAFWSSILVWLPQQRKDHSDRLRRWRIKYGFCPDCGYYTSGTDSLRCPECGAISQNAIRIKDEVDRSLQQMTDAARLIVSRAEQMAMASGSNIVKPRDIFIALFRSDSGVASNLLERYAIHLVKAVPPNPIKPSQGKDDPSCAWTQSAAFLLTKAQRKAARFDHQYVGTEHLLLVALESKDGQIVELMSRCGIDPRALELEIEELVGYRKAER